MYVCVYVYMYVCCSKYMVQRPKGGRRTKRVKRFIEGKLGMKMGEWEVQDAKTHREIRFSRRGCRGTQMVNWRSQGRGE